MTGTLIPCSPCVQYVVSGMVILAPTPPPPPSGLQPCNPSVIPATNGFGGILEGFGAPAGLPPYPTQPWIYIDNTLDQIWNWSIASQKWQ